jgi:DNA-directed RNA polymerase specialized sigma24 family protein
MGESDAKSTVKTWSISEDFEEFNMRVRKAAWKVCRGYQDYEDCVQDMLTEIADAQAHEPGFAQQTAAYQVTRAFWKAGDWRRHLSDREAKHVELDQPWEADGFATSTWADRVLFHIQPDAVGQDVAVTAESRLARNEVKEALAELAVQNESGRKKAEILHRRFYGEQTVAEASKAMRISKGTGCYYSAQGLKDLRVILTSN